MEQAQLEQAPMQVQQDEEDNVPIVVDRSKLTPNMRHYLQMSKLHSKNEYAKGIDYEIQYILILVNNNDNYYQLNHK